MDPIRNPYAPGAGQRPPELAGRDEQIGAFNVVLERVARGRPERSLILTGLRGVGKTVLLNRLRYSAVQAGWGSGKLEARPEQRLRRPLGAALHMAIRELGHPDSMSVLGTLKAFLERDARPGAKPSERWQAGITAPLTLGRADSGDIEIDLVELFTDIAGLAADQGTGVAVFIDEMQDLAAEDVSALCAAVHEIGQQGLPLVVVGAGLPHLPAVLSASKSYSERLFSYQRIDRLARAASDVALSVPASEEGAEFAPAALDAMYELTGGYPYFIQAYGKAVWDAARQSPISAGDVALAAPEAEAELAVGFFGSRFERATPAERDYLRAMAEVEADAAGSVSSADVASHLERKPQSLSPARDSLIKKGLVYSGERGRVAFTVPHFGKYLRRHG